MDKRTQFLTVKEVSEYLGLSVRTVQRLSKQGKIRGIKIGRQWKFYKKEIEKYREFGIDFSAEPVRKPLSFLKEVEPPSRERRVHPRINSNFRCSYSIKLLPFRDVNNEGIIVNISAGGVFLSMEDSAIDKIKIDDPVDLRFDLADRGKAINVKVKGRIVRKGSSDVDPGTGGNVVNGVGVRFRNMESDVKNRINQYIG